jgi:hypothetical protein
MNFVDVPPIANNDVCARYKTMHGVQALTQRLRSLIETPIMIESRVNKLSQLWNRVGGGVTHGHRPRTPEAKRARDCKLTGDREHLHLATERE